MSYDVIVKIIADGAKAKAEFDKTGKAAERMARKTEDEVQKTRISMEKFGRQAGIAGAAMIGAAGTVAFAMRSWVNSAQEAEMATMRLESSVKGAYGASSTAVKAFENQAKAIQKVTVASDEDVMSIQALLVQFGLTQRQVTQLTPLVVDISRKWGIDYVSAAKAVAKAADGKTTALKKLGINIDETKAKTDPYLATIDALRRAAGGFAEQEGKTFAGQTAILANQMDELKESLGRGVLSVLNQLLPVVNDVAGAFTGLDDKTGGLIGSIAAVGAGASAALGSLLVAISAVTKVKAAYEEATVASGVMAATARALPGIGIAIAGAFGTRALIEWAAGVNDASEAADKFTQLAQGMNQASMAFMEQFEAAQRGQAASFSGFFRGIYSMLLRLPAPKLPDGWGDDLQMQAEDIGKRIQDGIAREGYEKAFNKLLEINPQLARDLLEYAGTHDVFRAKLESAGVSLRKWRDAVKATADTNKDGRIDALENIAARDADTQSVNDYVSALSGAVSAQNDFAKASLGARSAQQNLAQAEKELTEARKSNDPEKIRDAQIKLESAYLAVADANRQVQDAAIKQAEAQLDLQNLIADRTKFSEAINHWNDLLAVVGPDSEIAKAIKGRIDDSVALAIQLNKPLKLNDPVVLASLARLADSGQITAEKLAELNQQWNAGTLNTGGVTGPLGSLVADLDWFRHRWDTYWGAGTGPLGPAFVSPVPMTSGPSGGVIRRAHGGPVSANTPYLVGEQGPELFVPTGNGMIVPNNQLNSSSGTTAGGITINVASSILSTPAETGAAVVDALTAWSRRNGRLPAPLVA